VLRFGKLASSLIGFLSLVNEHLYVSLKADQLFQILRRAHPRLALEKSAEIRPFSDTKEMAAV
jgi:hypothetical protein